MRIALIADIHANLPALEAALAAIRKHAPDAIYSLGDQINLGPCPGETLSLLRENGVVCLHGNHEGYVLGAMAGDERFQGANFESLRFNAARLSAQEITFPKELRTEGIVFCHSMPGDDRFPINEPKKALPRLREMRSEKPLHIVCGHGHNPTYYRLPNLTVDSIGSVGCMDDGVPGVTNFAILDAEGGVSAIKPYCAAYDTRPLWGLFKESGMAQRCPVMARLICCQMERNHDFLLEFLAVALPIADARGEEHVSLETWAQADARFAWPDGLTTADFWKGARR